MKSVTEILQEKGYSQDAALNHAELIPFVKSYLFRKNRVTLSFLIFNVLFFLSWIFVCVFFVSHNLLSTGQAFSWSAFGISISFLLAPIHELLHGLAYRICGAGKVSYKANWKKLYFMAIADKFITGRSAFYFIGLAPFVVISLSFLLLAVFEVPGRQVMWLTALWMHATLCAGDFGLMSYFNVNKTRDLITYDDAEIGVSYFYSRK
jgi:hypothetical protein